MTTANRTKLHSLQLLFHSIFFTLVVTLTFSFLSCSSDETDTKTDSEAVLEVVATSQLDSSATNWAALDLSGEMHDYTEWIGKGPVVLNFWGTWCPPCRRELPELKRMYDEFTPKGVTMISLAGGRDTPEIVRSFSTKNDMKWTMLMANVPALKNFGVTGFPTTIFLDKTGKEVGRFIGPRNYETFKNAFEQLL